MKRKLLEWWVNFLRVIYLGSVEKPDKKKPPGTYKELHFKGEQLEKSFGTDTNRPITNIQILSSLDRNEK